MLQCRRDGADCPGFWARPCAPQQNSFLDLVSIGEVALDCLKGLDRVLINLVRCNFVRRENGQPMPASSNVLNGRIGGCALTMFPILMASIDDLGPADAQLLQATRVS
jgi:hypothetical protein